MDKIKDKYEVILGFVTLVISLSAFKDELAKVSLSLGYITISLADYFLLVVYCLSICLYLYIVENIAKDTKIGSWKIFDITLRVAYFIFIFVLLTPLLLIINILGFKLYVLLSDNLTEYDKLFNVTTGILTGIISGILSQYISSKILKEKKNKLKEDIEEKEIKELDNASKLYNDGYYSHSVLESFKVLETHLYKKLMEKEIRVSQYKHSDIIRTALKNKIITENDIPTINDIRGMRNIAAHTNSNYTKQQADFALNYVKELISRK